MSENITYTNHEGVLRTIKGLSLTQDKAGRYWLWSDQLNLNLSYKTKTREDTLLAALESTLFLLRSKQERIDELSALKDKFDSLIESIQGGQHGTV